MRHVDRGVVDFGNRIWFLLFLISGLICGGCNPTPEIPTPEPPTVTVALPEVRDVNSYHDFTGSLRAVETVEIRARVKGYLEVIEYEKEESETDPSNEGSQVDKARDLYDVKKGDLLFVIEREVYESMLNEAKAAQAANEAQLDFAQANFERGEKTRKDDPLALSDVEFSSLVYSRDKAAADVAQAKAAVQDAQINLDYTEIRAPIDGRISRSLVDKGNLVGAGEQTLLATLLQVHPIDVYFDVNERVLQKARMDLEAATGEGAKTNHAMPKVRVGQDADGDAYPYEGVLDYVDNEIKESTRTGTVRASIPNTKGLLVPGSFARVRVEGDLLKDALLIQERAIQTDLNGKYVYVVDPGPDEKTEMKNVVIKKYVTLGQLTDDGMRVVTIEKNDPNKQDNFDESVEEKERKKAQLTKSDKYIVIGTQRARPGMPVTPEMEGAGSDSAPEEKPANSEK